MDNKRNFILGLGHQKCGTSWLYKYLCQSVLFTEGHSKEYHIWDRLDIPLFQHLGGNVRAKFQRSQDFYFEYFDKLLSDGRNFTADITPSYSGLKSYRLEFIKKEFSKRGIETKVVILVREPLLRIKSAVRFNLDRGNYSEGISVNETNFERALIQYYETEHCSMRTTYENIISEAANVFPSEQIYIGLYENMFERGEVKRLSEFLQIEPNFEFAKVKVNKTRNAVSVTDLDEKVKAHYANTYEYFYKNYPIANELWK